jgi:hypothetical protein
MLEGGRSSRARLLDLLSHLVATGSWQQLASRLLGLADEAQLLHVLHTLGRDYFTPGGGRDLAGWASGHGGGGGAGAAPLAFAGVRYAGIVDAVLANALACNRAQLLRVLQQDEDARGHLDRLRGLGAQLHSDAPAERQVGATGARRGGGGHAGVPPAAASFRVCAQSRFARTSSLQAHVAALRQLGDLREAATRQLLLLDAWLLHLHLLDRLDTEPAAAVLEPLLGAAGATWQHQQDAGSRQQGDAGSSGGPAPDGDSPGHRRQGGRSSSSEGGGRRSSSEGGGRRSSSRRRSGRKRDKKHRKHKGSKRKRRRRSGSGSDSDGLLDPADFLPAGRAGRRSESPAPARRRDDDVLPPPGGGVLAAAAPAWVVQLPGSAGGGVRGSAGEVADALVSHALRDCVHRLLQGSHRRR